MLNSIGLQGPGHRRPPRRSTLPALSRARPARLGLGRWLLGRRLRRHLRAPRRARRRRGDRAQSLVPERRGGARVVGRRSSPAAARAPRSRSTRSSRRRRGTSPSRRGPSSRPARTASRSSTRSAGMALDPATLRPKLGRGTGGYSGPALKPIALACVSACARAVDVPIVGMGGVALRARRSGARRGGRERCLTGHHPVRRSRRSGAHPAGARRRSHGARLRESARRSGSCQWLTRRNPCK